MPEKLKTPGSSAALLADALHRDPDWQVRKTAAKVQQRDDGGDLTAIGYRYSPDDANAIQCHFLEGLSPKINSKMFLIMFHAVSH